MTVQDYMAGKVEKIADSLASFIESTDPARLDWRPEMPGSAAARSALEQAQECIAVNRYVAALLRGEQLEVPAGGVKGTPLKDAADARYQLSESAAELATSVRNLDDAGMTKIYSHWRGDVPGEKLIIGAYRNMAYHAGQVNLIQMLSGDGEFHVPTTWY